mgnify:CR=1 FL=1
MVPWWQIVLIAIFGILAVIFFLAAILGVFYFRDSPSKGYQAAAVFLPLGMISAGIATSLYFQDTCAFFGLTALALLAALLNWLMSRFTRL